MGGSTFYHCPSTERQCNQHVEKVVHSESGYIADMSSGQIRQLEIDASDYPEYQSKVLRVPTFEESVKIISTGDIILNVDGSKVDWSNAIFAKRAVDILKKYGVYKKSFFVISDVNQRIKFNESYPDATLSWLLTDENLIDSAISEAKKYQRALLSIPLELATEVVFEKLRNTNIYYQIYNVNRIIDLKYLTSKKVRMVETDTLLP